LAAAEARPPASIAAKACLMPAMHVTIANDMIAPPTSNAELIAKNWAGPAQLRELPHGNHLGFTEGRHWSQLLLPGKGERKTQRVARALLTAFFLTHLTGTDEYAEFLEDDVKGAPLVS
ncbi:alpha/beta hydrolase, partial [Kibdelosporangium lantanae]